MKKISLITVLILSGLLLSGCGKKAVPSVGENVGEPQTAGEEQSFTGKIKDALLKGMSYKCTWESGDTSSLGYIKEKKYYGEMTSAGKTGYVLLSDNCLWSWDKEQAQGIKMCFEPGEEGDIWGEDNQNVPDYDYNCSPSVVSDSLFTPPAGINFTDIDQMLEKVQ